MKKQKTAIGYARRSKEKEQKLSIEMQKLEIEDYCNKNNIKLIGFYYDDDVSGSIPALERKYFIEANLQLLHDKPDYFLIWKYDRLARSVFDTLTLERYYETEKLNIKIISVTEEMLNGTDPTIQFARTVIMAASEFFLAVNRMRTKAAISTLDRQGKITYNPPFGYSIKYNKQLHRKSLIENKEEILILKEIFNMYYNNKYSCRRIAKILNENNYQRGIIIRKDRKYYPSWHHTIISRIINNKFYLGLTDGGYSWITNYPEVIPFLFKYDFSNEIKNSDSDLKNYIYFVEKNKELIQFRNEI